MKKTATTLMIGDQIFATLMLGGKTLVSVCKSNFATIDEVVKFITSAAGRFMGLAQLSIRNKTQGWTTNIALTTTAAPMRHSAPQSPAAYRQASLF